MWSLGSLVLPLPQKQFVNVDGVDDVDVDYVDGAKQWTRIPFRVYPR